MFKLISKKPRFRIPDMSLFLLLYRIWNIANYILTKVMHIFFLYWIQNFDLFTPKIKMKYYICIYVYELWIIEWHDEVQKLTCSVSLFAPRDSSPLILSLLSKRIENHISPAIPTFYHIISLRTYNWWFGNILSRGLVGNHKGISLYITPVSFPGIVYM